MRRSLLLLVLALAACGGVDDEAATTGDSGSPTAPVVTVTQPKDTAQAAPEPTGKPTFAITISAENRKPVAGTSWRYTVTAAAKGGGSAGGTAKMRVFVEDELVDTLGFFAFDGRLTRTHVWPAVLRGKKEVVLQAEVEGAGGTQRANLPVIVR